MAKAVAGCLCCLILAGPILIIVGIVLLAVKNTREDDVADYNKAVTAYDGTAVGSWVPGIVNLTSSSGGGPLTLYTNQPVVIEGNTEGVNTGYSNVLRGNLEPRSVSGSYHTVSFSLTSVPKFEQSVPISIIKTSTPWCSDARGCTTTRMGDICRGDHGPRPFGGAKAVAVALSQVPAGHASTQHILAPTVWLSATVLRMYLIQPSNHAFIPLTRRPKAKSIPDPIATIFLRFRSARPMILL